jgi:hypothetical protein
MVDAMQLRLRRTHATMQRMPQPEILHGGLP